MTFNIREFLGLAYYVSPLDQFLEDYDQAHPHYSAAQRQEMEKYQRIFALRDKPAAETNKPILWEQF